MLVTIAVRLPLLNVPLDADEGGYAYLARRWAEGGRLYGPVWVDRPPGLMLAYRAVTALGRSPVLIHLAASCCAAVLVVAVAIAAWAIRGPRAAVLAAALVAVAGSAPHLQGFMFNGELAAAAWSSSAVAAALCYRRWADGRLLVLAGVLGAVAIGMKQSGLDGLAMALVIGWSCGRVPALLRVVGGAALPTAAALVHAALNSWKDWWFAIVGYRLDTSAGTRGGLAGRWHNVTVSAVHGWPDLLPLALLAALAVLVCFFDRQRSLLPFLWLGFAAIGFGGGVFFFPHYWIQLIGPLCLLGALALAAIPPRLALAVTVAACLPALIWSVRVATDSPDRRDRTAVPDARLLANRQITPWLQAHSQPADQLYAFVSSADLYYSTGLHTDFRYLWQANLEAIPEAVGQLRDYLAGPDHPSWVVIYQRPDAIDPTGAVARVLASDYRTATTIDGYQILHSQ